MLSRTGEPEETELPDLHARPQGDRQVGDVAQFESDVPGEPRIDEPSGGVGEQPKTPQGGLPLKPPSKIVGKLHALKGRPKHKLTRMQHERLVIIGLDQGGEIVLLLAGVDVRVPRVVEDPKEPIKPNVDTRRLDHRLVKRFEPKPPGSKFLA